MSQSTVARKLILTLLALIILAAGHKGYKALVHSGKKPVPVQTAPQAVNVPVITVQRADIATSLTGYGTVRGKHEVLIIPEVEGKITYINKNFTSGKTVKKGEVLFKIDTRALNIQIARINGEISELKAQVETAGQEKENINRNLKIVTEHVQIALRDLKRDEDLFAKNMTSAQQVDSSKRDYLQERNAKINLENQLTLIPLKIKRLAAAIEVKKSQRDDLELKVKKSTVKAAFDGIIFEENVEVSQVVKTGQSVGTLVDASKWEIPIDLDEKNINHLNFEKFVSNSSASYPCEVYWENPQETAHWQGYISRVEKINESTRTVRVVVEIPNKNATGLQLAKGMFCKVVLPGQVYKNAISIPTKGLQENNTVYLSVNNRLRIKPISILHQAKEFTIVKGGLAEGDKIIVFALPNPVEGMPLKEQPVTTTVN